MTCLLRFIALGIFVASLGCGKVALPQKPQLFVSRESVDFGLQFGTGAYIGTMRTESIQIRNDGLEDLKFESAVYTGDSAFVVKGPLSMILKGKESTFLQFIFSPTAEKIYSGSLLLVSNADTNATTGSSPMKKINVSGRGFKAGDGG